jgi:hypothetical protein
MIVSVGGIEHIEYYGEITLTRRTWQVEPDKERSDEGSSPTSSVLQHLPCHMKAVLTGLTSEITVPSITRWEY